MKTRKELERSNDILFWMVIALLLVILVLTILDERKISKLERELQTCQDKVPVWTLKINCQDIDLPIFFDSYTWVNITNIGFNLSAEFEDYEDYQDALSSFKELNEYCEVLG